MLDIDFIRQNADQVRRAVQQKDLKEGLVDRLLAKDEERRDLIYRVDQLRAKQNEASRQRDIATGRKLKKQIKKLEPELKQVKKDYHRLMLQVPNLPHPEAPVGYGEEDNREVYRRGQKPQFGFKPLSHIELGEKLDILDLEAGVKTAGFRGYYLKNMGAQLHFAVLNYAWQKIIDKGFVPIVPPTILREFALEGSGHFPFGRADIYQIANPGKLADGEKISEPLYLAGTSEPALLAYFADKTFKEADLPQKVCAWTSCYRSEVGSYGRDTKGIYRIHEFAKVEQVVICRPDEAESDQWLKKMRQISEEILQDLELPYRVVDVCTGEMGAGKRRMYDIETWMPARQDYGETHSDSNLTTWQAERLNINVVDQAGDKQPVHTLNNTVLASPRILIAILENYQEEDGSVVIPPALQPQLGQDKITP